MSVQITGAGTEARSIMTWAWGNPQQRAVAALETVHELAASLPPGSPALADVQDAGTMLSRLVGTLTSDNAVSGRTLSAQLSAPVTIGEQLDLAAIHGHHIPGTQYTFRHGWIPLIGGAFNDPYPKYIAEKKTPEERKAEEKAGRAAKEAALRQMTPEQQEIYRKRHATVHQAGTRELGPREQEMLAAHERQVARAKLAARHATQGHLGTLGGNAPTVQEVAKDTLPGYAIPTEAHQAAVARGQALRTTPGTVGAKLQESDPALASLAAPGANMAALKAYIDARVAAEVARQTGQITGKQHDEVQGALAAMHRSQQRLIAHMRKTVAEDDSETNHIDRIHLAMYSLFTAAGVGVTIGGILTGVAPITLAVLGGIVPLVQIIHDYVRSD